MNEVISVGVLVLSNTKCLSTDESNGHPSYFILICSGSISGTYHGRTALINE